MAKIVPSDLAPAEAVHYSLGAVEFDLGGKSDAKSFETTDRAALSNAESHPWLTVEYDEAEAIDPAFYAPKVRPEDDVLSEFGPRANDAFDPEKVKAALEDARAGRVAPLAVESGTDQSEEVTSGPVAETLAADDSHQPAKSARNFTSSSTDADTEDNS